MLHSVMPYGMIFPDGIGFVIGLPSGSDVPPPREPQAILSTDPFAFLHPVTLRP